MDVVEPLEPAPTSSTSQPQASPQQGNKQHFKWNILTVYLFLISGLVITGFTVGVLLNSETLVGLVKNHFIITILTTSLLMTLNTNVFYKIPYDGQKGSKALCWVINCVLVAVPMLNVESDVLTRGVLYTLVLFLILSLKSFIIPVKIIELFLHPLTAIHSLVLVCTVYSVLFHSLNSVVTKAMMAVCLYGGFLVYSGLLICNTHRLCFNAKQPHFDPMFSAFVFFMNVINLFSRVTVFTAKTPAKEVNICKIK